MSESQTDWRDHSIRIVRPSELDANTSSMPGTRRVDAVSASTVGAKNVYAASATFVPGATTGAHHHGKLEGVIYVVSGRARMRWGNHLEYTKEAGPGEFIYVPPLAPHQEMNPSAEEPLVCVLFRNSQEPITVTLDMATAQALERTAETNSQP